MRKEINIIMLDLGMMSIFFYLSILLFMVYIYSHGILPLLLFAFTFGMGLIIFSIMVKELEGWS